MDEAMPGPTPLAKLLLLLGIGLVVLGALVWLGQYLPENLRPFRLPGDIRIERKGLRFYFPITTMILLSLIASGLFRLVSWWRG